MYLQVLNISGVAAVLLAEGRQRLPRWFFSHSASRAMIQTRCRSPGRVWNAVVRHCNGHLQPSATLWFHSGTLKHKTGVCRVFPLFSTPLRESLRWFNAVFERQTQKRGSLSEHQSVTPGSRTETISDKKHHPVTSSSHSSLTLECGRSVKFLI